MDAQARRKSRMRATTVAALATAVAPLITAIAAPQAAAHATFKDASDDGTRVVFETAIQLADGDLDTSVDVYQRDNGATRHISTGAVNGNGAHAATYVGSSSDGSRVFFITAERLAPNDADSAVDIYERSGGVTTLLSTAPFAGNTLQDAEFAGASADGTRVFFETHDRLLAADTDDERDVYERSGGATTLVSAGEVNGNGVFRADFRGSSADGTRVFFGTRESLVASDTDSDRSDVYERSGGATTLVSAGGDAASDAAFQGASTDGTRVFFTTVERLDGSDTDSAADVYERFNGTTTRISRGAINGNGAFGAGFEGASDDGTRVFIRTLEQLVAADTDAAFDIYEHAGGVTTLVSAGEINGNGAFPVSYSGTSADGSHVFISTSEQLVSTDTDTRIDVYERSGGATTHVSAGAINGNGVQPAIFHAASADGSRVFFGTLEPLTPDDTIGSSDVFVREAGATTLVSVIAPPITGSGPFNQLFAGISRDGTRAFFETDALFDGVSDLIVTNDVFERSAGATSLVSGLVSQGATFNAASADGTRVFFSTGQPLLPGDPEFASDVFERSGGLTTRLSTGPAETGLSWPAAFGAASTDSRVTFGTVEQLVPGDTDEHADVYQRSGSTTTLISTGPAGGNGPDDASFRGASSDGTRVIFETEEALVAGDTNGILDLYERAGGTTARVTTMGGLFRAASPDGTRVFYETNAPLGAADTDTSVDVYEYSGGTTTLVSRGEINGNQDPWGASFMAATPNGAIFVTNESLVAADTDGDQVDVYLRSGGTTTLISGGGNGAFEAGFRAVSADGSRVLFVTQEKLDAADTDDAADIYERAGGTTTLVSTGQINGNGDFHVEFGGASADATRVFFSTEEHLVVDDDDAISDLYERSGGVTRLVSTGERLGHPGFPVFAGASTDGARVFFETSETLVGSDSDQSTDVYMRANGSTTMLVSTGPINGDQPLDAGYAGASADGSRIFFRTTERLTTTDRDSATDIYERSGGTTRLVSTAAPLVPPAAPTLSATDPTSLANTATVAVRGSAQAGTTVSVFTTPDCAGEPVVAGSAARFASPGLAAPVAQDATTTFFASTTDTSNGEVSACSASSVSFTEDSTAPAAPVLTATTPASPADDNDPQVSGTAEPGSTVRIYGTGNCSGSPLASGSAAQFATTGLTIVVLDDSTTALRATSTDVAGNTSPCSDLPLSYVENTPDPTVIVNPPAQTLDTTAPETTIGKGPKARVKSRNVTFTFASSEKGSTFRCRLDAQPFTVCRSPKAFKRLKPGRHTFQVVAVDTAGNADPTPAKASFRVLPRRRR